MTIQQRISQKLTSGKTLLKTSFFWELRVKGKGELAKFFYDSPAKDLFVIGVTGTNGKTTTAHLLHSMLTTTTAKSLLISSLGTKIGMQTLVETKFPKRDVFEVNKYLAVGRNINCKIAVIEVSAEDIIQWTFEWIDFDGAILTNITQDHVDYDKPFLFYTDAKKRLFSSIIKSKKHNKFAIFPKDDTIGRQRIDYFPFDKKMNFGVASSAVLKAENIQESFVWTQGAISYLGKTFPFATKLLWMYNVYNILAALGMTIEMWGEPAQALSAITTFESLPGRMEHLLLKDVHYFFDIAHSPDALNKTLQFLTSIKKSNKLIVLLSTPGGKEKKNRSAIGTTAQQYADILIATDHDPNKENRLEILDELTSQITKKEGENFFVLPERSFALRFATEIAQPGDIVLITGKSRDPLLHTNFGTKQRDDKAFLMKIA